MVKAAQFDVCRVDGGGGTPLAVVLQHDALGDLSTRIVAPLIRVDASFAIDRATPIVELDGARYTVAVHLMATVPTRHLTTIVASLSSQESLLKRAVDLTFFGV